MKRTTKFLSISRRSRIQWSLPQCPNDNTNKNHVSNIGTCVETITNQNIQFYSNRICLWKHSHEKIKIFGIWVTIGFKIIWHKNNLNFIGKYEYIMKRTTLKKHHYTVYHRNTRSRYTRDKIQSLEQIIASK